MNALLIGCGNIGAMYDYYTDDILTHAKAYDHFNYKVDFIEPRDDISEMVVKKYGYQRKEFDKSELKNYDMVSISTPTEFHTKYLFLALKYDVPVVVCEKPITYNKEEIKDLVNEYKKSKSKVLVNYIRRFQEKYAWLKNEISKFGEQLQAIHCNYHKGILNSGSHALDLINYLTSFQLKSEGVYEIERAYDYFKKDPTISFTGKQDGVGFFFRGLKIEYLIFEIDLFYMSYRVCLTKGGKEVQIFKKGEQIGFKNGMTNNYMIDVVKKAEDLYFGRETDDNFEESILLNKTLIQILEQQTHAK